MLGVVDVHSLGVNVGLQCGVIIGKGGEAECHASGKKARVGLPESFCGSY